jgi:hypothetical protein
MKPTKPLFEAASADSLIESGREERQIALEYIAEAWNTAEDDGVEPDALAHASLFAAITTLVRSYGDETAAKLIETLPERIRSGEYDTTRSLQ